MGVIGFDVVDRSERSEPWSPDPRERAGNTTNANIKTDDMALAA
jgi:hypothetical protein